MRKCLLFKESLYFSLKGRRTNLMLRYSALPNSRHFVLGGGTQQMKLNFSLIHLKN